ncbi:p450 domain-containing protein [Cephalotus follicularis]|uniref:p450 domain-containing protein n=1 Tax=Cephalotus follicularis TaxID=3775 RepID=A0A1Q3BLI3_CEPFO|nr:p450 domain-containing protein [Cephalotus follicularis]
MSLHLEPQEIVLCGFFLAMLCLSFAINKAIQNKRSGRPPPEVAGAWPVIGHLHLLGPKTLLHRTLGAMADKYGQAFTIRLGSHPALVVSSKEVVKECFTTNDKVLSTRPKYLALKITGYDNSMLGFAPYGPYWRNMRKLVMAELLSCSQLELLKHVRDSEIKLFMMGLYELCVKNGGHVMVDMKEKFGDLAMDIIVRLIAGKQYLGTDRAHNDESRRCQKALANFFHLMGLNFFSDAVPLLGWIDIVKGYVGEMKRTARNVDCVFGSWVDEHRRKRLTGTIQEEEQDFIHFLLSFLEDGRISTQEVDTTIKGNCLSLILGGNDTTVITLVWALSLLLNNRHALEKAQEELEIHVGKQRQVEESDIENLVYLQAIVKETMRLYPALPLSGPREAMEDCTIAGFHVRSGTRLIVNLWKLHRDPSIWTNPLEFLPGRFLSDKPNLDFRGQDFEYVPFGSGRRMCPGISLAHKVLNLTLARLIHGFELGTIADSLVDMSESPEMGAPKATPLEVILTPRLPSMLYF